MSGNVGISFDDGQKVASTATPLPFTSNQLPAALGQGTMAQSQKVVLASDQSAVPIKDAPQTSGGYPFGGRVLSAATTNATNIKGSAGQVYVIALGNNSTIAYLKLYNKATAPVVGTDTPLATYRIPANGTLNIAFRAGKIFTTGISYAITGAAADSDTTAVAANQISGSIEFA